MTETYNWEVPEQLGYQIAKRLEGLSEIDGARDNPVIVAMHYVASGQVLSDEDAWCSSFVYATQYLAGCKTPPKSKALSARSWLDIELTEVWDSETDPIADIARVAIPGDIVVFYRESRRSWKGHVAYYEHMREPCGGHVVVYGGNQGDSVRTSTYPIAAANYGVLKILRPKKLITSSNV